MSRAVRDYEVSGTVPSSSESVMLRAHRNNSSQCSESSGCMGSTQNRFPAQKSGPRHYFCLKSRFGNSQHQSVKLCSAALSVMPK